MRHVGETRWSRSFVNGSPERILLGAQRVVYGYRDRGEASAEFEPAAVCVDLNGRDCWSMPRFQPWFVLRDDRVLGITPPGVRVLDRDGRPSRGIRDGSTDVVCDAIYDLTGTRDRLYITNRDELLVTDRDLNLIDRVPVPDGHYAQYIGDGVAYVQGDRIEVLDRRGRTETLCELPVAIVEEAMRRWERETGRPALAGVISATIPAGADLETELPAVFEDTARQTAYGLGDRPQQYHWRLAFVDSVGSLFLHNFLYPHIVACIGLDGRVRWCTYLSPACCGGAPAELPNGRLVVSSGCGGILSWLDANGTIVAQTQPHEGAGLATAYGSDVMTLSSSTCLVGGGPGLVAYGANGELLWQFSDGGDCYDYDEERQFLVTAAWSRADDGQSVLVQCTSRVPSSATSRGSS
jgi:hypothetical protein